MPAPDACAAILLAAGLSRRFGPEDKLMSPWEGRPLIDHAAAALAGLGFARLVAIVRPDAPELHALLRAHGYDLIENDAPETGMGHSIALGIAAAGEVEAALIALGDMPAVPPAHFLALMAMAGEETPVVASLGLDRPTVPAVFMAQRFDTLRALSGDRGAQLFLQDAVTVSVAREALVDIDRKVRIARMPGR